MNQLTNYILHALYEATGDTWRSVDVVSTLHARWPQLLPEDVKRGTVELATKGLVTLQGAEGAGHISGPGIQVLSSLWKSGAFGPIPPAAAAHVERLHALAETQSTMDLDAATAQAQVHAQRLSQSPRPNTAASVDAHAEHIRQAITVITQQISAAPDLNMDDWSQALEITAELDWALDTLTSTLRRGSRPRA